MYLTKNRLVKNRISNLTKKGNTDWNINKMELLRNQSSKISSNEFKNNTKTGSYIWMRWVWKKLVMKLYVDLSS